jgi:hypothetical protein
MERQGMEEERQGRVEIDRKKRLFELRRREKASKVRAGGNTRKPAIPRGSE